MNLRIIPIFLGLFLASCQGKKALLTEENVQIDKYLGTWFEYAKFPNRFEKGLDCITATYSLLEDGKIKVLNKGRDIKKDKYKDIEGTAEVPDPKYPGRLKVTFFKPFSADYYIFKVDDNYQYALVGSPNLKFLWVLSRNANLDDEIYQELLEIAESLGFDITQMEKINQDC